MTTYRQKPLLGVGLNRAHPLARGLVSRWVLNEGSGPTANDLAGGGNPLSFVGSPAWAAAPGGPAIGSFVDANSTQAYLSAGYRSALNTPQFTVMGYARLDVAPATSAARIVTTRVWSGAPGTVSGYILCADPTTSAAKFFVGNGTSLTAALDPTPLVLGVWYRLVATYDGVTVRLYKGGVQVATSTPGTIAYTTQPFTVGQEPTGLNDIWKGLIADIGYWNRPLAATEVAQLEADPYAMFVRKPLLYASAAASAQTASPASGIATWAVAALAITLGAVSVTPTAAVGTWAAPAVTVTSPVAAQPAAAIAQWTIATPATTQGAVTASPTSAVASWAIMAPTTSQGNVTAVPIAAVASWVAPAPATTSGAVTANPTSAIGTWVVPAVTVTAGNSPQTANPAAAIATWTASAPGIALGNVTASPASALGTWVVPAATASTGAVTASPTAAVGTWIITGPTTSAGNVTASPPSAVASWVVPTVTTSGAVTASAQSALGTWTVPAVTVQNPGLTQPLEITNVKTFPSVRITNVQVHAAVSITNVKIFPT